MTQIVRSVEVDAPHEHVLDSAASFFREQASDFRVQAIRPTSAQVEVRYSLLDDRTRLVRRHAGRTFAWRPRWRAFPRFGATLTVRPRGASSTLVLEGSYKPPGCWFGELFDRVIGERFANRTMNALLLQIKGYIERENLCGRK